MQHRWLLAFLVATFAAGVALALGGRGGPNFDHLSDADRKAMQERFAKEIWPMMLKEGKNGCVGCHALPKTGGHMKMTGDLEKDFRMLVRDGFFIPNDSGSIVAHLLSKDRKKRMPPPGKADPWTEKEIEVVQKFVADLDKKQKKTK